MSDNRNTWQSSESSSLTPEELHAIWRFVPKHRRAAFLVALSEQYAGSLARHHALVRMRLQRLHRNDTEQEG